MALLEELIKRGIIKEKEGLALMEEVSNTGKREEEVILEKEILPEEKLFEIKSEILKIPLKKIRREEVSTEVLKEIPEETAQYYKLVPLDKKGQILEIGMVYPEDLNAQEALNFLARIKNLNYRIFLITPRTFKEIFENYRTPKKEVEKVLSELEEVIRGEKISELAEVEKAMEEEAPISKIVGTILRYGVEGEASDIHIEPLRDKLRVRFRRLGKLYSSFFLPIKILPAIVARIKILSNLRIDETRIPQDGRFSIKLPNREIDFRVSTFPTSGGEKVAIRILDPQVGLKKFEELGLSGRNLEVVKRAIQKPFGMILATGPTGSGKTTTLYAILQLLNKEEVNVVTLEDPVEYFIEGINQSQIRPEINYDFARGLRHVLRQDPDIIMVGEIRDQETASLAIHAALTGHLVLSTLHTNNALGVIPRLIDLGVQPFLIPPTLSIALAQRLVRKLCDNCKKKVEPEEEIRELILKEVENLPLKEKIEIPEPFYIWKPVGCPACHGEGFSGRIALFEVLEMTPQLGKIILKEPGEEEILKEAKRQGMMTMKQDGIVKVLKGITTLEEVLRVTAEIEE